MLKKEYVGFFSGDSVVCFPLPDLFDGDFGSNCTNSQLHRLIFVGLSGHSQKANNSLSGCWATIQKINQWHFDTGSWIVIGHGVVAGNIACVARIECPNPC